MKTILFVLSFIWQLPQNIVALVFMLFCGEKRYISYKKYCHAYCVKNFNAGISLGNFCFVGNFYDNTYFDTEPYLAHEQVGHTYQSRLLGPLYLLVIGIPSLIYSKVAKTEKQYYSFYTERWANNIAGVTLEEIYDILVWK